MHENDGVALPCSTYARLTLSTRTVFDGNEVAMLLLPWARPVYGAPLVRGSPRSVSNSTMTGFSSLVCSHKT